jgi:hypothetical protein
VAAGRARLTARARRVSNLRRRVVAGALASFVLAWGVIAFEGPMGVPAQTTTTASNTKATPTATPDDSASAPVTTSQS